MIVLLEYFDFSQPHCISLDLLALCLVMLSSTCYTKNYNYAGIIGQLGLVAVDYNKVDI